MHILQNIHSLSSETMGQNRDLNYKGKGEMMSLDFIPIITTKQGRKYVALKRDLEQYILEYSKTKITSDIKQILKTFVVQHLSFRMSHTVGRHPVILNQLSTAKIFSFKTGISPYQ